MLGQSVPLSGPAAELGKQFHSGAKLLFDRISAKGGVNGRMIELRTVDDGATSPSAARPRIPKVSKDETGTK